MHATADFFVGLLLAHGAIGLVSGFLPVLQVDAGVQIGEIGLFSAVAANGLGLAGAVIGGAIVALDDIVVTGSKRGEKLRDGPGSVAVVDAQKLTEEGVTGGASALREIPGAVMYSCGVRNNAFITLRGVGPLLMPLSPDDSSVLTFVDGAPLMLEQSASSYLDLEQVEVLKRPQNTLFDRSTSGGAINLVPALPTITCSGPRIRAV